MQGLALKVSIGLAALAVGGIGYSLGVRSHEADRVSLTSARVPESTPRAVLAMPTSRTQYTLPTPPVTSVPPPLAPSTDRIAPMTTAPRAQWAPRAPVVGASPARIRPAPPVVGITPAMPPAAAAPVTGMPAAQGPAAAPPVTAAGGLSFTEEVSDQRNPTLVLENGESSNMTVKFAGPMVRRARIGPRGVSRLDLLPGDYQVHASSVSVSAPTASGVRQVLVGSNQGTGVFREYHRYYARIVSVPLSQRTPLRLGEQPPEPPDDVDSAPLVKPEPEQP